MNASPDFDLKPVSLKDQSRLRVLQNQDTRRSWASLEDRRICVLCDTEFRGRDVDIHMEHGQVVCRCPTPGCGGSLRHFVMPGNPLLEPLAWTDWISALEDETHAQA